MRSFFFEPKTRQMQQRQQTKQHEVDTPIPTIVPMVNLTELNTPVKT